MMDFIQMRGFSQEWDDLGLSDEDLRRLEVAIMAGPKRNPVVRGTGGLRKMRFAPVAWRKGKRGALRVCYVYFEEFRLVLLVVAYRKGETDDISAEGRKKIRQLIERQRVELARRFNRAAPPRGGADETVR
jgi:hypothetical protein